MDAIGALVPQGAREEWMLAAIAFLTAVVLAFFARFASPKKSEVRLWDESDVSSACGHEFLHFTSGAEKGDRPRRCSRRSFSRSA